MRCESQDMTAIPLEVFVPQVFPPGTQVFLLPVPVSLSRSLGVVVGVLFEHCMGISLVRDPRLECPEINSRVDGTALAAARSRADQPHLIGSESRLSPVPDPISVQPA